MRDDEDGLTLVEMMVAMLILAVIMMAMASVLITSAHSIRGSERVVHSTQLGNLLIEEMLALPFDAVALYENEATAHYGGTTFEGEDLVLLPGPASESEREERVPEPETTVTHEGVDYTVETAVVWEDDPATAEAQDYKRMIVRLSWDHRGEVQTARTEAVRSPDPEEHPLRATVVPDVVSLVDRGESKAGTNVGSFEIRVAAAEPQSSVVLEYHDRTGSEKGPRNFTAVSGSEKTEWKYSFSNNAESFANGGTLFEVTGTSEVGEKITTTMGRGVFLHDLEFVPEEVQVDLVGLDDDTVLPIHAETGPCADVEVDATVTGAMRNDPLTLYFLDAPGGTRLGEIPEGEEEPRPVTFESTGMMPYGAVYEQHLNAEDLHYAADSDELILEMAMGRSADEAGPLLYEHHIQLNRLEEGDSCPA